MEGIGNHTAKQMSLFLLLEEVAEYSRQIHVRD
jgi:hypothetical protein